MTKRNTIQKSLIVESLHKLDHPTAEEIWQDISAKIPSISLTTVYRNLKQMVEDNSILAVTVDKGAIKYDSEIHPHAHFYCLSCGKIVDIPPSGFVPKIPEGFLEEVEITKTELLLSGYCAECKIKEKN